MMASNFYHTTYVGSVRALSRSLEHKDTVFQQPQTDSATFRVWMKDSLVILNYNLGHLGDLTGTKLRSLGAALGKYAAKIDCWVLPECHALPLDIKAYGVQMEIGEYQHFRVDRPDTPFGGFSIYIRKTLLTSSNWYPQ